MVGLHWLDYAAMIVYMLAVVWLGIRFSKEENTSEDYLLGGRNLPWVAVGISCLMSLLSTYSLVMVPGEIYNHGLSLWSLDLIQPVMQIVAFSIFVRFYFRLRSFTPFEYLERRYDNRVRLLVASLYSYSRLVYLAMVLFATSKVFEGAAGWSAWKTILVVGVIGIFYTVLGGMRAVVWTDVLQFFVLAGGIGVAIVVLCMKVKGGFVGAISYAFEKGHGFSLYSDPKFFMCNPYVRLSFWLILLGQVLYPLKTAASDQITIQRLLSTDSYRSAFKAQMTSAFLTAPFVLVLWFIGLGIFSYYSQYPDPLVKSGDVAFFRFIAKELPTPMPGLILAGMLAAVMSTLDSGMNSLAAVWLKEFHQKYINKEMTERFQVTVSRYATFIIGAFSVLVGILISVSSEELGQSVVEAATIFAGLDVIIFPAFLFAVLSRRANARMIWILAALLWGLQYGMVLWYGVSTYVAKHWCAGEPLGLSGAISAEWVIVPFMIFLVLFVLWIIVRVKTKKAHNELLGISLFPFGWDIAMMLWYYYSNHTVSDKPLALSFQWVGLPTIVVTIIGGAICLLLSKPAEKEKYWGLTLTTYNKV